MHKSELRSCFEITWALGGAFQKHRTCRQIRHFRPLQSHFPRNRSKTPHLSINPRFEVTWLAVQRFENTAPVHKSEPQGHLALGHKARKHRTCKQIRFSEARNYTTVVKSEVRAFENTAPVHKSELQGRLPRGSAVNWMLENTAPSHKSKLRGHLAPGLAEAAFVISTASPPKY